LEDREAGLDLVEPGGVDRRVNDRESSPVVIVRFPTLWGVVEAGAEGLEAGAVAAHAVAVAVDL
jgi:hypothetical protein